MKKNVILGFIVATGMIAGDTLAIATSATRQSVPTQDVEAAGAFGFPQAQVLCDMPGLRVSVWNNRQYLFLQAILRGDSDPSGETRIPDGRAFGDQSAVSIDVDADGKITADVDRTYYVNPLVNMPGLRYVIAKGTHGETSVLQDDSAGRGSIRYIARSDGSKFRVDNFLIPLAEIHRAPGDKVRLVYCGTSVQPSLELNSLGIANIKYVFQLPLNKYQTITLSDRSTKLDPLKVPEGRQEKTSE